MFVHGALCVSYSGQCFSSEAWGGRSANRGQCAQACRLPYEMLVDGEVRPLGDARYLLSPEDLYALREIPEIVELGISALKIEGRYKDENYVALTTRAYRKAVDEAWSGLPLSLSEQDELQLVAGLLARTGSAFPSGHQSPGRGAGTFAASPRCSDGASDEGGRRCRRHRSRSRAHAFTAQGRRRRGIRRGGLAQPGRARRRRTRV